METNSIYPNFKFDEPYINNNKQNQTLFSGINLQSLLPSLLSGKGINDILPKILKNSNPMLANIMNLSSKSENSEKIESDKIDVNSLTKVN